jgi:hypothetical protein
LAEKQRRRAEREALERAIAGRERRERRLRAVGAATAIAIVLVGLAALTTLGNGSDTGGVRASSSAPFGQHYDGLDERRVAAGVSTHDDTGTIHNEGQAGATLGQFFAIWGVPFSSDRLGPYRAGSGRVVQMWVDRKPSRAWGSLNLADGQDVRVTFGQRAAKPPPG